jgi:hypothetical protein
VQSLINGGLGVERPASINLGGNLSGDNVENLRAELDEQVVEGGVDLSVNITALLLTLLNGSVDQAGIFGLLGSSEDEGGVGGSILGLVLVNGGKVTGVANDNLIERIWLARASFEENARAAFKGGVAYGASGLELFKRRRHCEEGREIDGFEMKMG